MNNKEIKKQRVTKPDIELKDFYKFLDQKIIDKIEATSIESKNRISHDVMNLEKETENLKNILNS